ncbi:uncharacterized protein LOC117296280 [Asterias rubens]|uniref:uncharacterized protein LOC117296280 n=1 Tax=Asterias rubens TaxID=7604 RepID=UPI001455D5F2|nr:uncharacterized protein LOC117296280 [Asterias rubens]
MATTLNLPVFLALAALSSLLANAELNTIVFTPTQEGTQACLIIIPGAEISGGRYKPLAEAIQASSPLQLWIGITSGYRRDTPNPLELTTAIDLALSDLRAAGMGIFVPVFMAGHSLGGVFGQDYAASNANRVAGILLWGSYLTGANRDLASYPVPVAQISGELDGLTRVTRFIDTYSEMEALEKTTPGSNLRKPVIILEGLNHGQFASGDMPPNVVTNDIKSNLTFAQAHDLIGRVSSDFITITLEAELNATGRVLKAVEDTGIFLEPLMEAKTVEADGSWISRGQEAIINVPSDLAKRLVVKCDPYTNQRDFAQSKPSVTKESTGIVTTKAKSKANAPRNLGDVSLTPNSAFEIAAKMKRQEAVNEILGGPRYNDTVTCKEINMMALKWAEGVASSAALSRYATQGRQMKFNSDIATFTGSSWLDEKLRLTYNTNGDVVVTSVSLLTSVSFPFQSIAGMQYCKLLSPYRALEWIYVDSLRPY